MKSNTHITAEIIGTTEIARDVFETTIATPDAFTFLAGQYIWIILYNDQKQEIGRRAFSIASPPNETDTIRVLFRNTKSEFKQQLIQLQSGATITIDGPYGSAFCLPKIAQPLVCCAGGVGIAPFLSLLRHIDTEKLHCQITLLYSEEDKESIVYRDLLEEIAERNGNITIIISQSTDRLFNQRDLFIDNSIFYISGPQQYIDYVNQRLDSVQIPDAQRKFEALYPTNPYTEILRSLYLENEKMLSETYSTDSVEFRYQLLFRMIEQSSNHTVITDLNGQIMFANRAAQQITGFTFKEMKGHTPRLWGGLMDPDFYNKLWESKTNGEIIEQLRVTNRRKNGDIYYAQAHISPIFIRGDLVGWVASEEEITELEISRHRVEEAKENLEKNEQALLNLLEDVEHEKRTNEFQRERLRIILDNLPIGVFIANAPNGEPELINKQGMDLLNIHETNRKVQLGKYSNAYNLVREDGTPYDEKELPLSITLATKQQVKNDDVYIDRKKDLGRLIPLMVVSSPILGKVGNLVGAIVVFQDITQEKNIDKAKTEFVSLASHQLRTPLSAINWFTEMLLSGDAGEINDQQKQYLEEVAFGSKRMVALVNSLLNVSRLELGTFAIDPEPTDIVALTKDVMREIKPSADERKHTITTDIDESLGEISLDPKLMRMVLQNFLSNAVKYTPENGQIKVMLQRTNAGEEKYGQKIETDSLFYAVSDNGLGIPESQKSKIFEKLFRADNVRATDTEGTGLGLYIIKSIVDHVGGQTWFESTEGQGTTFCATIPISGMKVRKGDKQLAE